MVVEKLAGAADGWEPRPRLAPAERSTNPDDLASPTRPKRWAGPLAEIHPAIRDAVPRPPTVIGARYGGDHGGSAETRRRDRARTDSRDVPGLRAASTILPHETLDTQRVHGDFHLGQTLHTPKGWKIIDFEGEPAKTMAERPAPDCVWRDIAGMLRSFDYAAASVPGPASSAWAAECRAAVLARLRGRRSWERVEANLLRAYEADKAIYEVVYEMRNRPDWVGIPLGAVADLAGCTATRPPDDQRQPTEQNNA